MSMLTVGITALVIGVLFVAVGFSNGICATAFLVASGCFVYEIHRKYKETSSENH